MMKNNLELFINSYVDSNINNDMKEMFSYALNSGGKRFRPNLFLSLFEEELTDKHYYVASAIEFTHTYSLIHDDLPCMDNDLFRRGRKSLWNKYGEDNALLVGDGFISESFKLILKSDFDNEIKLKLIDELINKSGSNGMIYGQYLDINDVSKSKEEINYMYSRKTGDLLSLCFSSYAIIKGLEREKYSKLGHLLGLLFQYQDDYMEYKEDPKEKNDADIRNNKNTVITVFEDYLLEINSLKSEINEIVCSLNLSIESIKLINKIVKRDEDE